MTYTLVATSHFERRLARFRRAHPKLRQRIAQLLRDLEADPLQPSLRLHPLKGRLAGLHAVRLTYAYRLTRTLKLAEHEIILLDIGSHDDVYDYLRGRARFSEAYRGGRRTRRPPLVVSCGGR